MYGSRLGPFHRGRYFHPSVLPFFHTTILPSFHPSFLRSLCAATCIYCRRLPCIVATYVVVDASMESPALYRGVGRDDLIKLNFYEGYNYRLIICFLFFVHGISLSLRHLKRILQGMNLRRRMYPTSHGTISLLIQVYYNYY